MLVKKNELERLRTEMLEITEKSIIERAKRDSEIEDIGNEEVRENVKSDIEDLRAGGSWKEKDRMYALNDPEKLLNIAEGYRERTRRKSSYNN